MVMQTLESLFDEIDPVAERNTPKGFSVLIDANFEEPMVRERAGTTL